MKKHIVSKLRNIHSFITSSRHPEAKHKKRIKEIKCKSCATLYPPWQMKYNKKTINFKTLLLYDCFVRFLVRVHKILKCFTRGKFLRESTIFERRNLVSLGGEDVTNAVTGVLQIT